MCAKWSKWKNYQVNVWNSKLYKMYNGSNSYAMWVWMWIFWDIIHIPILDGSNASYRVPNNGSKNERRPMKRVKKDSLKIYGWIFHSLVVWFVLFQWANGSGEFNTYPWHLAILIISKMPKEIDLQEILKWVLISFERLIIAQWFNGWWRINIWCLYFYRLPECCCG